MGRATKTIMIVAAALAIVGAGAVAGYAVTGNDDDTPLTGSSYDQATAAAVQAAGGGTVTETEAKGDGSAYEVEVRRSDGSHVEVDLDGAFKVTATEADDNDDAGDDDGPGDDQDEADDADDAGEGDDGGGEADD